jgi:hypothetical protein
MTIIADQTDNDPVTFIDLLKLAATTDNPRPEIFHGG